jgi:hypothetical protein
MANSMTLTSKCTITAIAKAVASSKGDHASREIVGPPVATERAQTPFPATAMNCSGNGSIEPLDSFFFPPHLRDPLRFSQILFWHQTR